MANSIPLFYPSKKNAMRCSATIGNIQVLIEFFFATVTQQIAFSFFSFTRVLFSVRRIENKLLSAHTTTKISGQIKFQQQDRRTLVHRRENICL